MVKLYISAIETKLMLTFKIYDIGFKNKLAAKNIKHVLSYCDLSNLEEDMEGEKSPKEGKYSASMNTYLSFMNRN